MEATPQTAGAATASAARAIDCVVGHHMNPHRSGVARFNLILAERFAVPVLSLWNPWQGRDCPMLSFKPDELSAEEIERLSALLDLLDESQRFRFFVHELSGLELELEERLVRRAEVVYCGNDEALSGLRELNPNLELLWSPGMISDLRTFSPAEISVFSFGMAHKIRADEFERLRDLLEATERSYALYISSANHETATIEDAESVFEEVQRVFPHNLYFLGHLSDVAVYNQIVQCSYFAAFFKQGARANNSTVVAAMEHGAVVITNLDEHSPDYLVHMENVIDVNRCEALPEDPLLLRQLSVHAIETARSLSWEHLMAKLGSSRTDMPSPATS